MRHSSASCDRWRKGSVGVHTRGQQQDRVTVCKPRVVADERCPEGWNEGSTSSGGGWGRARACAGCGSNGRGLRRGDGCGCTRGGRVRMMPGHGHSGVEGRLRSGEETEQGKSSWKTVNRFRFCVPSPL